MDLPRTVTHTELLDWLHRLAEKTRSRAEATRLHACIQNLESPLAPTPTEERISELSEALRVLCVAGEAELVAPNLCIETRMNARADLDRAIRTARKILET